MLRKFTAMTFLLVMAMLITLKHPVLGYCLCLDSYFAGDCVCQFEKSQSSEDSEATATEEESDLPCPGCCATKTVQSNGINECNDSEDAPVEPVPCDDCTEHLNIDVGDFVWHSSDKVPSDTEVIASVSNVFDVQELKLPAVSFFSPMSIRGDPPAGQHDTELPLYLRHLVLRL